MLFTELHNAPMGTESILNAAGRGRISNKHLKNKKTNSCLLHSALMSISSVVIYSKALQASAKRTIIVMPDHMHSK